jgi:hypothetical protein
MTDYDALAAKHGGKLSDVEMDALAAKLGAEGRPLPEGAYPGGRPPQSSLAGPLQPRSSLSIGSMGGDVLMGARQALDAAAQMAARTTGVGVEDVERVNREALADYQQRFAPETRPATSALARGAGQALATAPVLPARLLAAASSAAPIVGGAAGGAATGALGGALTPVYDDKGDFWKEKREQVGEGAAAGGAFGAAGGTLGRVLGPKAGSDIQQLAAEKVRMTPGQLAGGIGKSIEDRLAGFPIIGDMISKRRFEGVQDFNRAIYSRAVAPFGDEGAAVVKQADVGHAGIAKVGDFLSSKYEAALAKSGPAKAEEFVDNAMSLLDMVPSAKKADFEAAIDRVVFKKITPAGTITPSVAKAADSELGRLANQYRGSADAEQREFALALREAQSELRELFAKYNPETAQTIRAADQGWATLVQMERAGGMAGARDGIFTPAQLLNAIKRGETSIRKRGYARGESLNQEFAETAQRTLPSKVPDSGTAGRALTALLLGEAGGSAAGLPGAVTSLAAPSLMYAPGMTSLATLAATRRPEAARDLGQALKQFAPYLGFGGAGLSQ